MLDLSKRRTDDSSFRNPAFVGWVVDPPRGGARRGARSRGVAPADMADKMRFNDPPCGDRRASTRAGSRARCAGRAATKLSRASN